MKKAVLHPFTATRGQTKNHSNNFLICIENLSMEAQTRQLGLLSYQQGSVVLPLRRCFYSHNKRTAVGLIVFSYTVSIFYNSHYNSAQEITGYCEDVYTCLMHIDGKKSDDSSINVHFEYVYGAMVCFNHAVKGTCV